MCNCNLGEGLYIDAYEKGYAIGYALGCRMERVKNLIAIMDFQIITLDEALNIFETPEDEKAYYRKLVEMQLKGDTDILDIPDSEKLIKIYFTPEELNLL